MVSLASGKRMSIQRRILFMVSAAGLCAFLLLGFISFLDMYRVQTKAMESGERLGSEFEVHAEELIVRQTKEQLQQVADAKAQQINREIVILREDTEYLAYYLGHILMNPELYETRTLNDPRRTRVRSGEAYMLSTPAVMGETVDASVLNEMGIVTNAADGMEVMCEFYKDYKTSCYIGSKHGYMICADIFFTEDEYAKIHSEELHGSFDPRERPWYKLAEQHQGHVLTEMYMGTGGHLVLTSAAPYFDRDGFAGVCAIDANLDLLYESVSDQSIGETTIYFAIDKRGNIIFSSEKDGIFSFGNGDNNLLSSPEHDVAAEAGNMIGGSTGVAPVTVEGEDYYLAYAPVTDTGWSFGTMLKRDEAVAMAVEARRSISAQAESFGDNMRNTFLGNLVKLSLLLLLLGAGIFSVSKRAAGQFISPILTLTEGVREIAKGNLDKKLEVKSGDEIEELSESMNRMTANLKKYIQDVARARAEQKRVATEMDLARGIQEGMLPDIHPGFSDNIHYSIAATMEAAKEVGGDFYDFYALDEEHLAVTVADVSDKGIPAALFMAVSKTILKHDVMAACIDGAGDVSWGRIIEGVNLKLCENNDENMFVTVFFGVLNVLTGEFTYVNAGHNAPLLGRVKGGNVHWNYLVNKDARHMLMLGAFEESVYKENRLILEPGDMLYLYTDGVTEAMNLRGKLYSEESLRETLNRGGRADADVVDILKKIREDIDRHTEGAEQSDDMTMLGLRFLG